jgi:hypothetical protein
MQGTERERGGKSGKQYLFCSRRSIFSSRVFSLSTIIDQLDNGKLSTFYIHKKFIPFFLRVGLSLPSLPLDPTLPAQYNLSSSFYKAENTDLIKLGKMVRKWFPAWLGREIFF